MTTSRTNMSIVSKMMEISLSELSRRIDQISKNFNAKLKKE